MNVVEFFKKVAESYNQENRCGHCWTFGAPLSVSGLNQSQPTENCCVHLFLTSYVTESTYEYTEYNAANRKSCDHSFTLYALQESRIDLNVFNEIKGHDISESLWETILRPLQECLGCGAEFDLCELGYDFNIIRWRMEVVTRFEDQNYAGWKITAVFREQVPS